MFLGGGTHITREMCLEGKGRHITRDMCFPGREGSSQERTRRALLKQSVFLFLLNHIFERPFFSYFSKNLQAAKTLN